jgi:two-component system, OmpR family, alkaline phosphatase synthesis response regulator PhoP
MIESKDEKRILLIDDDVHILLSLKSILEEGGYTVKSTDSGRTGLQMAREFKPHLIILDVMMPGQDGIETCYELRQIPELAKTLIAFYTGRTEDYTQIAGFSAGADDYIVKPIKPKLLLFRINALMQRVRIKGKSERIELGEFKLDRASFLAYKGEQRLELTRKEFDLLLFLLDNPRKVYTRYEIYEGVWGGIFAENQRTIDVHIRKIREKIGEQYIKTIKGVGYCFNT